MPGLVRRRLFSGVPLDTLILISSLFGKCGSKLPPQSLQVRRATVDGGNGGKPVVGVLGGLNLRIYFYNNTSA